MKNFEIRNTAKNKARLLKLKLLKTKVYKKKNCFISLKIEDIEYRLKKALHIIYKYHINNKRVLFVGTSSYTHQKLKQLVRNTKHVMIPESIWTNGIIANPSTCFRYLSENQSTTNKKISKILFHLKKRSDLIVILNQISNLTALEESYNARIPIISLNSDLNILDVKPSYKIPGNFSFNKKKIRDNFFYSILNATFKKTNKDIAVKQKSVLKKHKHKFLSFDHWLESGKSSSERNSKNNTIKK